MAGDNAASFMQTMKFPWPNNSLIFHLLIFYHGVLLYKAYDVDFTPNSSSILPLQLNVKNNSPIITEMQNFIINFDGTFLFHTLFFTGFLFSSQVIVSAASLQFNKETVNGKEMRMAAFDVSNLPAGNYYTLSLPNMCLVILNGKLGARCKLFFKLFMITVLYIYYK